MHPVEAADLGRNELAGRAFWIEPEKLAGGVVEESDDPLRVQDDDPLVQGLEDFLEKSLLANQAGDDLLDIAGNHTIQPCHQFF